VSFKKHAKVSIVAVGEVEGGFGRFNTRMAAKLGRVSYFSRSGLRIDLSEVLDRVSSLYDISPNPKDFGLVACKANSVEIPNDNGDAFPKDELLRFEPRFGRRVYRSYEYKPFCLNHRSEDPKGARGVILDAHYNDKNSDREFVETLVAFDKTKDAVLAKGIKTGSIDGFSMGCSCGFTICSVCENVAYSRSDFCDHIKSQKMAKDRRTGQLIFERCFDVEFEELSSVGDPADPTARTTELIIASRKGMSDSERDVAQRFLQKNAGVLPSAVIKALTMGVE